jgi:hypothetical protein
MADTKNYHSIGYGSKDGELKFGHIHDDGVVSAAMLRSGQDPNHYVTLEGNVRGTKSRKNGTMCVSPGTFSVRAGETTPNEQPGIFLDAVNGDIVLAAPNGRIRIFAENIDLIAEGADGKNGVISIFTNEKIILDAGQSVDIKSKVSTKVFSEKSVELIGNAILNIYGGLIESMDGATSGIASKGSKTSPIPTLATITEIRQKIMSFIASIS